MQARRILWLIAASLFLCSGSARAHKGSDAYLDVQQLASASERQFHLTLAVAIKDIDLVLPVDANSDGKVTWGEIKAATPQVLQLIGQTASLTGCAMQWRADGVERRSDGAYLRFLAEARCPPRQAVTLNYSLFKDQDATHRLLIAGRVGGHDLLTTVSPRQSGGIVLAPSVVATPEAALSASDQQGAANTRLSATGSGANPGLQRNAWAALRDYFALGVHHLLEGYDHLAFLLALVLPLRLSLRRRKPTGGAAVGDLNPSHREGGRSVWFALLRTITAFTIGHSITLILATLGLTQASPVWVEPMIALSIAVTALLNLRPVPWLRVEALALLFGMVHGFGFAGLLQEAAAPTGLLPWALAGFNLGVEAGQLIAVSGWILLSQPLVARPWYPSVVVRGGSAALIGLATWWFWQRVF